MPRIGTHFEVHIAQLGHIDSVRILTAGCYMGNLSRVSFIADGNGCIFGP